MDGGVCFDFGVVGAGSAGCTVAGPARPGVQTQGAASGDRPERSVVSDQGAVVDDRLRVHGMTGLRVGEASILPAIMVGERCAAFAGEELGAGMR